MEAAILNSIVFGTLQPWQKRNQNEQTFSDLLHKAAVVSPSTAGELNTALQTLLRDHPGLHKTLPGNTADALPPTFFKAALPEYFNTTTEYYLLLMQYSELHFLHQLQENIRKTTHHTEAYYFTNTALQKIKYIAAGAASELTQQNLAGVPASTPEVNHSPDEQAKRNTHFILYVAKLLAFKIFFEIQTRYVEHIKAPETEKHFYLHTFKEPLPAVSPLSLTSSYFNWKAERTVRANPFSIQEAIQLLNELRPLDSIAAETRIVLENVVLSKLFEADLEDATLANFANTANLFEQVKQSVAKEINQHTYGYQRFEVIAQALNKINFQATPATSSALGMLQQWLNIQAEAYKGNLSSSFAVVPDANQQLQQKTKPLPKTDKATIESQKQQAQEFLKHFSGHNVLQKKIMSEADYNRLLQYTFHLIEHEKLPDEIKPIPKIGLSGNHVRYTYYLMHQVFYGTNEIKNPWIDFLQQVFQQLSSQDWGTLKTKFSVKPKSYDADILGMSTS